MHKRFSRRSIATTLLVLLLVVGGVAVFMDKSNDSSAREVGTTHSKQSPADNADSIVADPSTAVVNASIGGQDFKLEKADSIESQQKGLSGRSGLGTGDGMLFSSDIDEEYCMWMKDMKFAIDIVWLDADQKVVYMEQDVKPETYPQDFCATSRYVVELPAGTIAKAGIMPGQKVDF